MLGVASSYRIQYRKESLPEAQSLRLAPDYEEPEVPISHGDALTEYQRKMLDWMASFDGYMNTEWLVVGGWGGDGPDWLELDGSGLLAELRRRGLVQMESMRFGQREFTVASVPDRHGWESQ